MGRETDERLFSPYCTEEAVDHESLYLSLCSRREGGVTGEGCSSVTFGEIFLQ